MYTHFATVAATLAPTADDDDADAVALEDAWMYVLYNNEAKI